MNHVMSNEGKAMLVCDVVVLAIPFFNLNNLVHCGISYLNNVYLTYTNEFICRKLIEKYT